MKCKGFYNPKSSLILGSMCLNFFLEQTSQFYNSPDFSSSKRELPFMKGLTSNKKPYLSHEANRRTLNDE